MAGAVVTLPFQSTHAAEVSADENDAYNQALTELGLGNTQSAIEKFQALVARQPRHQGALLDLALAYCQLGLTEQAGVLFERLKGQPDLPPGIGEVVNHYQSGVCKPKVPQWRAMLAVGVGQASNLNQAPGSGLLYLAPLGVTLQLSDKSRPKADAFFITEATLSRQATGPGLSMGVFLQGTGYARESDFDNTLAQGVLSYRRQLGQATWDTQGALWHQTLAGQDRLTSLSATTSAMWPVAGPTQPLAPAWQVGGVASWSGFEYPNLPSYRSQLWELRGRANYLHGPALRVSSDLGWSVDKALADRPGGDREGPVAQLGVYWTLAQNQTLELVHKRSWMSDSAPYSPVFFGDVRRSNQQSSWYGVWRYRMSPRLQWRVEGRYGTSTDAVELFNFDASSLAVMLEWPLL